MKTRQCYGKSEVQVLFKQELMAGKTHTTLTAGYFLPFKTSLLIGYRLKETSRHSITKGKAGQIRCACVLYS